MYINIIRHFAFYVVLAHEKYSVTLVTFPHHEKPDRTVSSSQPCTFPYEQSANQVWSLHRPRSVPSQTCAEHEQNEEFPVTCNIV